MIVKWNSIWFTIWSKLPMWIPIKIESIGNDSGRLKISFGRYRDSYISISDL